MTPEERGWVAGFLEGEGSFQVNEVKGRHYGQINVNSTDEDNLHQLEVFTGMGRINGPYQFKSQALSKKPHWTWSLTRNEDIRKLCSEIIPLMSIRRREQIEIMLGNMETKFYNGRSLI